MYTAGARCVGGFIFLSLLQKNVVNICIIRKFVVHFVVS